MKLDDLILSEEEFSKQYIEPFCKAAKDAALKGDNEAKKVIFELTGMVVPAITE